MLARQKLMFLWRSTKEVNMLCPTRFVVDATKNSKAEGVAAEVSPPRLAYNFALFFETVLHVYVRTTYDQIYSGKNNN